VETGNDSYRFKESAQQTKKREKHPSYPHPRRKIVTKRWVKIQCKAGSVLNANQQPNP
jgi:hypothetical protein